jgi:hypothetical protein
VTTDPGSGTHGPPARRRTVNRGHGIRPAAQRRSPALDVPVVAAPVSTPAPVVPPPPVPPRVPLHSPRPEIHRIVPETPHVNSHGVPIGALGTVLAGGLALAGCLLPWVTVTAPLIGTMSRNATMGGDGTIAIVLSIALIVVSLPRFLPREGYVVRAAAVLTSAGVLALGISLLARVNEATAAFDVPLAATAALGPGLWVLVAGGAVGVVAGLLGRA